MPEPPPVTAAILPFSPRIRPSRPCGNEARQDSCRGIKIVSNLAVNRLERLYLVTLDFGQYRFQKPGSRVRFSGGRWLAEMALQLGHGRRQLLDVVVLANPQRRRQAAIGDDDDAVGGLEDLKHLGAEDHHAVAGAGEGAQQPVDLALALDVDAAGRLLEEDEPRLADQRLGDRDLLLVAAGQRADGLRDGSGS